MVSILNTWLKPDDVGLEWGSGRSTIWLARRVKCLTSVEHDGSWYREIGDQLRQQEISNVDYHLCRDEAAYVSTSEKILPESLDFCLVDGIARDQCATAAIPKLKPGGILIVDNCNWYLPSDSKSPSSQRAQDQLSNDRWKLFLDQTKSWRFVWTTNGVTDTAFWVKP
jgi:predicted O-methyltransferase YrrM